jgi:hypothetical protein
MKMKVSLLALGLAAAIPLAAAADPAPGSAAGPGSPEMRAQFERVRTETRTAVFAGLSADHRAQVQAIVDKVNAGTLTDPLDAAKQIDAVLTPDETKAVLAERAKLVGSMHGGAPGGAAPAPGGAAPGGPPPGGQPPGAPPPAVAGAQPVSAGRFILRVSIAPERLHDMMRAMRGAPAGGPSH